MTRGGSPVRSSSSFDAKKMRSISKSDWVVLGFIAATLAILAVLFFVPLVVTREAPIPKHQVDMPAIVVALRTYHLEYGKYPAGSTEDIMKALCGDNERKIVFLEAPPEDHGVMKDAWGKPYDVTITDKDISVRTAGSDGLWNTADDFERTKSIEQCNPAYR